jgi:hypothetical protein
VWEREARWLALLEEGARLGERPDLANVPSASSGAESIREFTDAVKAKLPQGVTVPGTPSIVKILRKEGDGLAAFYVYASQYVHATEYSTRQWRANLGVDAAYGERIELEGWQWPLWMAWLAFRITAVRLIEVKGDAIPAALQLVDNQVIEAREVLAASLTKSRPDPLMKSN